MTTAFQADAFQVTGFQIDSEVVTVPTPSTGGGGGAMRAGSGRWVRIDKDEEGWKVHQLGVKPIRAGVPWAELPLLKTTYKAAVPALTAKAPLVPTPRARVTDDSEVLTLLEMLDAA